MTLFGEITVLGSGALKGATTTEAPHIKKKESYYYLLVSEGGTGINHAVTISRSKNIRGPYQQCPYNPILTHRHLQSYSNIRNVGHADIVETQTGEWWMVCLVTRYHQNISIAGRETFLVPVEWNQENFPIVNPGIGMLKLHNKLPSLATQTNSPTQTFFDDFSTETLHLEWTNLRKAPDYLNQKRLSGIGIQLQATDLQSLSSPSVLLKRVGDHVFSTTIKFSFIPKQKEEAGIILFVNNRQNIRLTITPKTISLISIDKGEDRILEQMPLQTKQPLYLKVQSNGTLLSFYYSHNQKDWVSVKTNISLNYLASREFTGLFAGIYASSNGEPSKNEMHVHWFSYEDEYLMLE